MRRPRTDEGGRRRRAAPAPAPGPDVFDPPGLGEPTTFGTAVRHERERRGLTAAALAAEVGLDESVILGAEVGATVLPRWSIQRLEAALDTSLARFLPRRPGPSGR